MYAANVSEVCENPLTQARLSFFFPGGHTKMRRAAAITAAKRQASFVAPNSEPKISMRPKIGDNVIREIASPRGIICSRMPPEQVFVPWLPSTSSGTQMAPSWSNSSKAVSTAARVGGSGARERKSRTSLRNASACKHVLLNSHLCISGVVRQGACSSWAREYSRKQRPQRTRPARPVRWMAELCDTHTVSSVLRRRTGSYATSRMSPASITTRTSSMVTLDSAMLVPRITFVFPAGGLSKMSCCSALGKVECNGKTQSLLCRSISCKRSAQVLISAHPGRKHKTLPGTLSSSTNAGPSERFNTRRPRSSRYVSSFSEEPHQIPVDARYAGSSPLSASASSASVASVA
mmetsp:Transcript_89270/g.231525  ORF Transcript_89270/g.231525 Transcript_89270/m.231525 type:complete len:348 (-) Transcript_89270:589-1632(-)